MDTSDISWSSEDSSDGQSDNESQTKPTKKKPQKTSMFSFVLTAQLMKELETHSNRNITHYPDSSTVPKYPQVSLVKILGVGCYFRDCEIRTRKLANSLENLQMCSKSCKYALNVCKYA